MENVTAGGFALQLLLQAFSLCLVVARRDHASLSIGQREHEVIWSHQRIKPGFDAWRHADLVIASGLVILGAAGWPADHRAEIGNSERLPADLPVPEVR